MICTGDAPEGLSLISTICVVEATLNMSVPKIAPGPDFVNCELALPKAVPGATVIKCMMLPFYFLWPFLIRCKKWNTCSLL